MNLIITRNGAFLERSKRMREETQYFHKATPEFVLDFPLESLTYDTIIIDVGADALLCEDLIRTYTQYLFEANRATNSIVYSEQYYHY